MLIIVYILQGLERFGRKTKITNKLYRESEAIVRKTNDISVHDFKSNPLLHLTRSPIFTIQGLKIILGRPKPRAFSTFLTQARSVICHVPICSQDKVSKGL